MIEVTLSRLREYAELEGLSYADVLRAHISKLTANLPLYEAKIERLPPEHPDWLALVQHRDEVCATIELMVGELDAVRNLEGG